MNFTIDFFLLRFWTGYFNGHNYDTNAVVYLISWCFFWKHFFRCTIRDVLLIHNSIQPYAIFSNNLSSNFYRFITIFSIICTRVLLITIVLSQFEDNLKALNRKKESLHLIFRRNRYIEKKYRYMECFLLYRSQSLQCRSFLWIGVKGVSVLTYNVEKETLFDEAAVHLGTEAENNQNRHSIWYCFVQTYYYICSKRISVVLRINSVCERNIFGLNFKNTSTKCSLNIECFLIEIKYQFRSFQCHRCKRRARCSSENPTSNI